MMKNTYRIYALSIMLFTSIGLSAPVGSGFNYQGELLDNGTPVNGSYDIQFLAFTVETGGSAYLVTPTFLATTVTNGLFSIDNVDFTDSIYFGEEYWIEVNVKQAGASTYVALSPRQRFNAVPYAVQSEYLAAKDAKIGDVLQFNGVDWSPAVVSGNISPWNTSGSHINYTAGKVSVGTTNTNASLMVDVAAASGPAFIANIDSTPVVTVAANGGTTIGSDSIAPDNGLYVAGDTKQSAMSNGMLKYMLYINCGVGGGILPSTIYRSYIGTNTTGSLGISKGANHGQCVIQFPTQIDNRFWVASAAEATGDKGANCLATSSNVLTCQRYTASTGVGSPGQVTLLVY